MSVAATYKAAERKRRRDLGETCVQVWLTADQRKNLEYIVEAEAKPIQQAVRDAISTEYMICRGWVVASGKDK